MWVNFAVPDYHRVQVIDTTTQQIVRTLEPGKAVLHMEFTPRGESVWISARDDHRVTVFDTQSFAVQATMTIDSPSGISSPPRRAAGVLDGPRRRPAPGAAQPWQRGFPLVREPFAHIGATVGLSATDVLDGYTRLQQEGALSRIGGVFAGNAGALRCWPPWPCRPSGWTPWPPSSPATPV